MCSFRKTICGIMMTLLAVCPVHGQQVQPGESGPVNTKEWHERAVALARGGQYPAALNLFSELAEMPNLPVEILFDYAVTAAWAGDYTRAVLLYETGIIPLQKPVPAYVTDNIARAYYRLGQFGVARDLYHELAAAGNGRAGQWEAQCLTQLGDSDGALRLYDILLESQAGDSALYAGRALAHLRGNNPLSAMQDAKRALDLPDNTDAAGGRTSEVRAELAAAFIRSGEYSQAIILLEPAIRSQTATRMMECDYVLALSRNGDYGNAIAAGQKLWRQPEQVPLYGRRGLADAYLRVGRVAEAAVLYQSMAEEAEFTAADRQSLAFSWLLAGNSDKALGIYKNLLRLGTERAALLAYDAEALLNRGSYAAGKQLFQVILDSYPEENLLRQRFAERLAACGMFREAWAQYRIMLEQEDGKMAGAAGVVATAVMVGDYREAVSAARVLQTTFPHSPATAHAAAIFQQRRLGEAEGGYRYSTDYKGNTLWLRQWAGEQRIGNRLLFRAGQADRKIGDDTGSRELNSYFSGVQYADMQQTAGIWGNWSHRAANADGYGLQYRYFFGEHSSLEFLRERLPVYDVQALDNGTRLTENRFSWDRQIGKRDAFTLSLGKSIYSDGNHNNFYDFFWNHKMLDKAEQETSWFLYITGSAFGRQIIDGEPTDYESPKLREAYGGGIRQRWNQPQAYWESTITFEEGRDRPEPLDFSPGIRLEYGRRLSSDSLLQAGIEYGARTGRSTNSGSGLHFGHRQYEVMYRQQW